MAMPTLTKRKRWLLYETYVTVCSVLLELGFFWQFSFSVVILIIDFNKSYTTHSVILQSFLYCYKMSYESRWWITHTLSKIFQTKYRVKSFLRKTKTFWRAHRLYIICSTLLYALYMRVFFYITEVAGISILIIGCIL